MGISPPPAPSSVLGAVGSQVPRQHASNGLLLLRRLLPPPRSRNLGRRGSEAEGAAASVVVVCGGVRTAET